MYIVYSTDISHFTLVMGPAVDTDRCCCCALCFGLNADMLCDTPSARMNCSRSSMFVRPLAVSA